MKDAHLLSAKYIHAWFSSTVWDRVCLQKQRDHEAVSSLGRPISVDVNESYKQAI